MFDAVPHDRDPIMLAMFIDGEARFRKSEIGEGADWHGDEARPSFDHKGDGRSAIRTEAISGAMAAVGDTLPCLRVARVDDLVFRPARLCGKSAATALLAIETMAHRNADRLACAYRLELPATAGGCPGRNSHGFLLLRREHR